MRILSFLSLIFFVWSCSSNSPSNSNSNVNRSEPKQERVLYLIRHGKSDHLDTSLTDFERHLSKKGKQASNLMGQKLMQRGLIPDRILISPSKRTKSTAKRIARALNFEKDSIVHDSTLYRCKTQELISAIRSLDPKYKSVIIVGHNPSTIQVANHFQKDTIFTSVPTTGIIAIKFESYSWENLGHKQGKFMFFDYPKRYKVVE
jgi:phosphohistidine phosphatase